MTIYRILSNFLLFAFSAATTRASDEVSLNAAAIFADCPQMVVIPKGSFVIGNEGGVNEDRYEGPRHEITIDYSFAVWLLEITTVQYRDFVNATGYTTGTDCRMWTGKSLDGIAGKDWLDPGYGHPPWPTRAERLGQWCH
jgi:formylglycine-generating enzyme required for sulfatase activity